MIKKIFSIVILSASLVLIIYLFKPVANLYLNNPYPAGGDYFNGVTYAVYFSKHLPFPPTGWLNFWHQGIPIVGGYPTTSFYLMSPLFKIMTPEAAMEVFTIYTQLLFLLFSLLMFWEVSRSVIVSLILTLIVLITRATYYQLFAEGLIVAANAQWFLPATLLFIFLFIRTKKTAYLITSAIFCGLSLVFHPPMATLTVLLPSSVFLFGNLFFSPISKRFLKALLFIVITFSIGSSGIYNLLITMFKGAGSQPCNSPQCWGIYPFHLQNWLTSYVWIVTGSLLIIALIIKFINRSFLKSKISFKPISLSLIVLSIFILYPLLAYLHLINTPAATIFPRRTFWALNLLLVLVAASSYRYIAQLIGKKISLSLSFIILLIFINFLTSRSIFTELDVASFILPNTTPDNIEQYTLPKYKSQDLSNILPQWVIKLTQNEKNYRFDSFNPMVTHWWNTILATPSTRGYSNFPTAEHASWLYYLQKGTGENKKEDNQELVRNRTLFLLDHFAIRLYEDSASGINYDQRLLQDKQIFPNSQQLGKLSFYEISPKVTSPIISATNATPFLIISDESGYDTIVRALSLTGLNSRKIIPVKGPQSINKLTSFELDNFPILFFYRFKGNNWKAIKDYVTSGGKVIIELGSLEEELLPNLLPEIFPMETVEIKEVDKWQLDWGDNKLKNTDLKRFSPPVFMNNPWKIFQTSNEQIRSFAKVILTNNNSPVILSGDIGKGSLIVSGLNLPFHIVQFDNLEESTLFKQLLGNFTDKLVDTEVIREIPENITVKGNGFNGVYFKENFDTGWQAELANNKLPVYKAGPAFMYIPIPKKYQQNSDVNIKYKGNFITWGLFLITIVSLFISLLSLITHFHLRLSKTFILNKIIIPVKTWIAKE